MRHAFEIKNRRSLENSNPFLLKKPNSNGPLKCGGIPYAPVKLSDKQLLKELKRLGWTDEFRKGVLNIKRKIFDGGKITPAESGQIDGVNLNKKSDALKLSMYINRWHMLLSVDSISDKKRCRTIDEIKNLVEKNLPEVGIAIMSEKMEKVTKKKYKYMVQMKIALNKPDELCEGGKNPSKIQIPPRIHVPTKPSKSLTPVHGC